jgi:hypothetical protein
MNELTRASLQQIMLETCAALEMSIDFADLQIGTMRVGGITVTLRHSNGSRVRERSPSRAGARRCRLIFIGSATI